jgi:hypothetical protein
MIYISRKLRLGRHLICATVHFSSSEVEVEEMTLMCTGMRSLFSICSIGENIKAFPDKRYCMDYMEKFVNNI